MYYCNKKIKNEYRNQSKSSILNSLKQLRLKLLPLAHALDLLHSFGEHLDLLVPVVIQEGVVLGEDLLIQLAAHVCESVEKE